MSASTPKSAAPPKSFVAFVRDDESRLTVAAAAKEAGFQDAEVALADLQEAVRRLQKAATPRTLLVDLAGCADPIIELGKLADVCDEGTQVVTVGEVNDVRLFRELMAFGVQDYLVKPMLPTDLARALKRITEEPEAPPKPQENGQLIAVVGTRGGIGATTTAVNTAWLLAKQPQRRVALVDFDVFFGTCSLALDLEVGRGFREALENPARIDALFIERAMVRVEENLFLLSAEESLENRVILDPKPLELLLTQLRHDFTHVVIDLPRFAARTQLSLFTAPAAVVIVSDPSLPGMRDTLRLHTFFKKYAAHANLQVALNRVGANRAAELATKDFEQGSEAKVGQLIPFDAKLFAASATSGKPIGKLQPRAKATAAFQSLAVALSGAGDAPAKAAVWKRWIGLKR